MNNVLLQATQGLGKKPTHCKATHWGQGDPCLISRRTPRTLKQEWVWWRRGSLDHRASIRLCSIRINMNHCWTQGKRDTRRSQPLFMQYPGITSGSFSPCFSSELCPAQTADLQRLTQWQHPPTSLKSLGQSWQKHEVHPQHLSLSSTKLVLISLHVPVV